MGLFLNLLLGFMAFASESTPREAKALFQNYEFKRSLAAWMELHQKSPGNWDYVKNVADLQLLLEGRANALETLRGFLGQQNKVLSPLQKQEVLKKIIELSELFLKEEAQTHYLQALSKAKLNEWNASLSPVTQAAALEPDNLKLLTLKHEIEKKTGLHDQAYETLKNIRMIDPLSIKPMERLAEAHIFHGKYLEAKSLLEQSDRASLSNRGKLALAVSLLESGDREEAQELIEPMVQNKKMELSQHPVTLWMAYRLALEDDPKSKETQMALKTFLTSSSETPRVLIDGWDPYRIGYYRSILAK